MNREQAYKELVKLVDNHPADAANILVDIIVDVLLFPEPAQDEVAQKVATMLAMGSKIAAIKYVRDKTGLSLVDCKAYVEGLPPVQAMKTQEQEADHFFEKLRSEYDL
jgi:ribosomal protein L7/L12